MHRQTSVTKEDGDYCQCIKIPYFSMQSVYFRKSLTSTLKKINKEINIPIIFVAPKIKQFFSIQDRIPLPLRSGVIYQFTCEVDPRQSYVGKTYRHLGQRIKEHSKKISAIYDHRLNCTCNCNTNNFKIIDTARDHFALNIKEAIHIKYTVGER